MHTDARARIKSRSVNELGVSCFASSVRISGYARNFVVCAAERSSHFEIKHLLQSIKRSCHKLLRIFERRQDFRGLYLNLGASNEIKLYFKLLLVYLVSVISSDIIFLA